MTSLDEDMIVPVILEDLALAIKVLNLGKLTKPCLLLKDCSIAPFECNNLQISLSFQNKSQAGCR